MADEPPSDSVLPDPGPPTYTGAAVAGEHWSLTADEPPFVCPIPCEGSGAISPGWCPMCAMPVDRGATIPEHDRDDIIGRLVRGDFDAR